MERRVGAGVLGAVALALLAGLLVHAADPQDRAAVGVVLAASAVLLRRPLRLAAQARRGPGGRGVAGGAPAGRCVLRRQRSLRHAVDRRPPRRRPATRAHTPSHVPDDQVVVLSLEEPVVFVEIFNRHYRRLRGLLATQVRDDVAGELAGQVMVAAFLERARSGSDVGRWLDGLAGRALRHDHRAPHRATTRTTAGRGGTEQHARRALASAIAAALTQRAEVVVQAAAPARSST